ncbi:hypothetical protein D8Y20_04340 [Mariprofundus sp. EBB-1]|uniref:PilZ domain-containing protein n=1 Tax=Mariprofundus sp. EBB-1 TaxID=2650971 RepID=UPI000EF23D58|nr:PilZ domain-containing protein [Mariprofundus sp. EBB-1]RLL53657.1 hypothetical protein D8Y20_04340 [Mariprofundus sp. EBB-1]
MENEMRTEKRHVTRGISTGELYHLISGQYFRVEKVCDISANGVGLKSNACLQQGEKIRMGFKRGRAHIEMIGRVAWCALADEDDGMDLYRMGIIL